ISKGQSDPAILQDLVDHYGVRVLAAPPAAGFDLTVWVLPGIGLIVGLAIVLVIVRRWRKKPPSGPAPNAGPAPDAHIMAAVEEEMSREQL
ncbi:MAG: cytochrome c-type biogenesis protein CcmH, partial [Terriglobia bacterium]